MIDFKKFSNSKAGLAAGAAVLIALGAAGGAGAVQVTRPSVEMAPTVATPIVKLAASSGVVTVKGRVAEVYGDRFVVQDGSGRTMVAAGRDGRNAVAAGQPVTVQGHYDDGQLRASFLVDGNGQVEAVGPGQGPRHGGPDAGPGGPGGPEGRGPHGPGGPGGPGRDGPPPPPPGCAPAAGPGVAGVAPPPPPVAGQAPVAPPAAIAKPR